MRLINIGLDEFDGGHQEVFVTELLDDGTTVNRKLSDLLDLSSEAATEKAKQAIGEKRLK